MLVDFGSLTGSLMIVLFTVAAITVFGSFLAGLLIRVFDVDDAFKDSRSPVLRKSQDHPVRKAA